MIADGLITIDNMFLHVFEAHVVFIMIILLTFSSLPFHRVSKQALLSELRQCIEKQLETLLLPSQFVLLRNLGRCLTWVSGEYENKSSSCLLDNVKEHLDI